jgi:hypothetical protein
MMPGLSDTATGRDRTQLASLLTQAMAIADRVDPIVAIHVETALAMLRAGEGGQR